VLYIAPIVEGYGDVEAVPALLHRIAVWAGLPGALQVNQPIRVKAASFLSNETYFGNYVQLAAEKAAQQNGSVLILLDCEDDCPGTLGPEILNRARGVRSDVGVLVALAYREYETWFIAGAESLRGLRGLPSDLTRPTLFEAMRDAKGWLGRRMDESYDPVTHQIEFTRALDLDLACESHSFNRLCQRIRELLEGTLEG